MVTLLILAWLVPCICIVGRAGQALRRSWVSPEKRAPLSLPLQRRGT